MKMQPTKMPKGSKMSGKSYSKPNMKITLPKKSSKKSCCG